MSTTVENRVVEMRFENDQFEKNIHESINSLDQLNKSLKFDGAAKSFKAIDDASGRVSFDSIANRLDKLNSNFTLFGRARIKMFDTIAAYAGKTGQKIYNSIFGQIASGGWSRASNIAQAKFQLKGLGIAWEEVADDISYAVDGTAYGLDSAAKAASQLSASGVQVGDEMKAALRGISGVAAMTNSEYDDVARIFATVAGNGRVMAQQLNQLGARGLNAAATLADSFGVSESELREMVSKGKVSFADFSKAMDNAFGEHAKDANTTFVGSLSNVRAALSRIGELFATPWQENLIGPLNALRNLINGIKTELVPLANVYSDFLSTLSKRFGEFLSSQDTSNGIQNIIRGMITLGASLAGIVNQIGLAFNSVFGKNAFRTAFSSFTKAFFNLTQALVPSKALLSAVNTIFKGLFTVLKGGLTVISHLISLIGPLANAFLNIVNSIVALIPKFREWINTVSISKNASRTLQIAIENIKRVLKPLSGVFESVTRQMTIMANAIVEKASNILKSLKNVRESIAPIVTRLTSSVSEVVKPLIKYLSDFPNRIKDVRRAVTRISEPVLGLISNTKSWIDTFAETNQIIPKVVNAWEQIKDRVLKLNEAFKNGLSSVAAYVGSIKDIPAVNNAFEKLSAAATKAKTMLGSALETIQVTFSSAFEQISKTNISRYLEIAKTKLLDFGKSAIAAGENVAEFAKDVYNLPIVQEIISRLEKVIASLGPAIVQILGTVSEKIRSIVNSIAELQPSDWAPVLNTLQIALTNIVKGFDWIVSGIKNFASFITGKLSSFTSLSNALNGVTTSANDVTRATNGLRGSGINFDNLSSTVQSFIPILRDFAGRVYDFLSGPNGLDASRVILLLFAASFIKILFSISRAILSFPRLLGTAGKALLEIAAGAKSVEDALSGAITGIKDSFVTNGQTLVGALKDLVGSVGFDLGRITDAIVVTFTTIRHNIAANMLLKIAASIAIFTGSIILLANLGDSGKLQTAAIAIGAMAAAMYGIIQALQRVSIFDVQGNFSKNAKAISNLALALGVVTASMVVLQKQDFDVGIWAKMLAVLGIIGGLGLELAVISNIAPQLSKGSSALISMSIAFGILALVSKKLNETAQEFTIQSAAQIFTIVGSLVLIMKSLSLAGDHSKSAAVSGLLMTVALGNLLLVLAAAKLASRIVTQEVIDVFFGVILSLGGLMVAASAAGEHAASAGVAALLMSISLHALIGVLSSIRKNLSEVSLNDITTFGAMVGSVTLLLASTRLAGEHAASAGVSVALMSFTIRALINLFKELKDADLANMVNDWNIMKMFAVIVSTVMGLTAVTALTEKAKPSVILAMLAAVLTIAGTITLISELVDPHSFIAAGTGLSIALTGFAAALAGASKLVEGVKWGAFIQIITMLAGVTGSLLLLAEFPWQQLLAAGSAIALLAFTLGTVSLFAQKMDLSAIAGLALLSVTLIPLSAAIRLLADSINSQQIKMAGIVLGGLAAGLTVLGSVAGLSGGTLAVGFIAVAGAFLILATGIAVIAAAAIGFAVAADTFTNACIKMAEAGPPAAERVSESIRIISSALGEGAALALQSFATTMSSIVNQMVSDMFQKGINIVDGLINGIKSSSVVSNLINAATGIYNTFMGTINSLFGIHSPADATIFVGKMLVKGLVGGIVETKAEAFGEALVLGQGVTDNLNRGIDLNKDSVISNFESLGATSIDKFKLPFSFETASNIVSNFFSGVKDTATSSGWSLTSLFQHLGFTHGNAYGQGLTSSVKANLKNVSNVMNVLSNEAKDLISPTNLFKNGVFSSSIKSQIDQTKKVEQLAKSFENFGKKASSAAESLAGPSGSGTGGASKAASTTKKEVKALFDVMKDGKGVVEAFRKNYTNAMSGLSDTEKLDRAKQSVSSFAETIFKASTKYTEELASMDKNSEEYLAAMKEAWDDYDSNLRSTISGQVDMFEKFESTASVSSKDLITNLNSNIEGLESYQRKVQILSRMNIDPTLTEEIIKMGTKGVPYIKALMNGGANLQTQFSNLATTLKATTEDAVTTAEAAIAYAYEKWNNLTNDSGDVISQLAYKVDEAVNVIEIAKENFTEKFEAMRDVLQDSLGNNLDIFGTFNEGNEVSKEDLFANLDSMTAGYREWGKGLAYLIEHGVSDQVVQKLAEMGTSSIGEIRAMMEMSDLELERYSEKVAELLAMPKAIAANLAQSYALGGTDAVQSFIKAIGDNAPGVSRSATELMEYAQKALEEGIKKIDPLAKGEFISIQLKDGVHTTKQGAIDEVERLAKEMLSTLEGNLVDEGRLHEIAMQVCAGLELGFRNGSEMLNEAMSQVVRQVQGTVIDEFEIGSPSKWAERMMKFVDMGFANGLTGNSGLIETAADSVSDTAMRVIEDSIKQIIDMVSESMDSELVITPVLDLSEVEARSRELNGLIGGRNTLSYSGIHVRSNGEVMQDAMSGALSQNLDSMNAYSGQPITIQVYAAPGQSEEEIANIVENKLNARVLRKGAVWGR